MKSPWFLISIRVELYYKPGDCNPEQEVTTWVHHGRSSMKGEEDTDTFP